MASKLQVYILKDLLDKGVISGSEIPISWKKPVDTLVKLKYLKSKRYSYKGLFKDKTYYDVELSITSKGVRLLKSLANEGLF